MARMPGHPVVSRTARLLGAALTVIGLHAGNALADSADLSQALYNAVGDYGYYKTPETLATVKQVLAQGAKPDTQTLVAAVYSKAPDALDLLIPKVDAIDAPIASNGETLLMFALNRIDETASDADIQMIKRLIKAGADVNVIARGRTASPLQLAATGGSKDAPQPVLVKLLLASGADAKLLLGNGFTPLTGRGAGNLEVIKLLIAAGTDPYHVTTPGSTALHFVCERPYELNDAPDPQAAQRIALLHKPGTLDAFYPQKGVMSVGTALLEAARSHNPDCVKALIAAGASLKAPAFSPTYMEQYPDTRQQTVREYVLSSAKESPILYSAEVTKLFK